MPDEVRRSCVRRSVDAGGVRLQGHARGRRAVRKHPTVLVGELRPRGEHRQHVGRVRHLQALRRRGGGLHRRQLRRGPSLQQRAQVRRGRGRGRRLHRPLRVQRERPVRRGQVRAALCRGGQPASRPPRRRGAATATWASTASRRSPTARPESARSMRSRMSARLAGSTARPSSRRSALARNATRQAPSRPASVSPSSRTAPRAAIPRRRAPSVWGAPPASASGPTVRPAIPDRRANDEPTRGRDLAARAQKAQRGRVASEEGNVTACAVFEARREA